MKKEPSTSINLRENIALQLQTRVTSCTAHAGMEIVEYFERGRSKNMLKDLGRTLTNE
jgi:hypothetical protein